MSATDVKDEKSNVPSSKTKYRRTGSRWVYKPVRVKLVRIGVSLRVRAHCPAIISHVNLCMYRVSDIPDVSHSMVE
jgi:hypothetical protein